jgi:hypothetical protein
MGLDITASIADSNMPLSSSLGYWAVHEQYSMQDLLQFIVEAERNRFATTMTIFILGGMIMLMVTSHGYG